MPNANIKAIAKKSGKSEKDIEKYWAKGEDAAREAGYEVGQSSFYPYVMGVVKRMAGIKEGKTITNKLLNKLSNAQK